jgi:hypothetical protein
MSVQYLQGRVSDVVDLIEFLCSSESSYITSFEIFIDDDPERLVA